jgi:hypothetical protein
MCRTPFADAPEEPMLARQVLTRKLFRAEGALLEAHGLNTENWNQSKSASPANFCALKAIKNLVFAHLRFQAMNIPRSKPRPKLRNDSARPTLDGEIDNGRRHRDPIQDGPLGGFSRREAKARRSIVDNAVEVLR